MSKQKGDSYERELVHLFKDDGWFCRRAGGSGAGRSDSYDLIAARAGEVYVMEVKYVGKKGPDYTYVDEAKVLGVEDPDDDLPASETMGLVGIAEAFGGEPRVVGRFWRDTTFHAWTIDDCPRAGDGEGGNFKVTKSATDSAEPFPPS